MPRFFLPRTDAADGLFSITGEDARHIARVLRMRAGETVVVCDGGGTDHTCELVSVGETCVEARTLSSKPSEGEPSFRAVLFVALQKGDKMDFVVQKSVELGASAVVPFASERSVARLDEKSAEAKRKRWQRIAYEAAKQSGRGRVPEIGAMLSFEGAVEEAARLENGAILYENEREVPLKRFLEQARPGAGDRFGFLIGSEGGFSPREHGYAVGSGLASLSLGRRILRCETVPMVLLSALLYHTGEM